MKMFIFILISTISLFSREICEDSLLIWDFCASNSKGIVLDSNVESFELQVNLTERGIDSLEGPFVSRTFNHDYIPTLEFAMDKAFKIPLNTFSVGVFRERYSFRFTISDVKGILEKELVFYSRVKLFHTNNDSKESHTIQSSINTLRVWFPEEHIVLPEITVDVLSKENRVIKINLAGAENINSVTNVFFGDGNKDQMNSSLVHQYPQGNSNVYFNLKIELSWQPDSKDWVQIGFGRWYKKIYSFTISFDEEGNLTSSSIKNKKINSTFELSQFRNRDVLGRISN